MGCGATSERDAQQREVSKEIERELNVTKRELAKEYKILLLGLNQKFF